MSRSRNTGTPCWAKVDTLPQERRFSERAMIDSVLEEMLSQDDTDDELPPTLRSCGAVDGWDDQPEIFSDRV